MERWVQHYSEVYFGENVVTEEALNAIKCFHVLEELDSDPSLEDLNKAVASPSSGRAPGNESIPAEVLKCCKGNIISELHQILCPCWREDEVPKDVRDANIVTLYKNKGNKSDCNNYRGICLLSIMGKLLA